VKASNSLAALAVALLLVAVWRIGSGGQNAVELPPRAA
jgi:hypothetical protein